MGNILSEETQAIKMLLVGDSGTGKTGAIAALSKDSPGFKAQRLIWADFDNGLDIVKSLCRQGKANPDLIYFKSFQDKLKLNGTSVGPVGVPDAFTNFMKALNDWRIDDKTTLGPIEGWGPDTTFVLDSFTHLGNARMRYDLTLVGRQFTHPQIQDWGAAMEQCERVLGVLYSSAIKCNVIVCAHVNYQRNEFTQEIKGLPMALGEKLSPKVPTYFNTLVVAKTKGSGPSAVRTLHTVSVGGVEAKVPVPGLAAEFPQATGLVDIYKALKG